MSAGWTMVSSLAEASAIGVLDVQSVVDDKTESETLVSQGADDLIQNAALETLATQYQPSLEATVEHEQEAIAGKDYSGMLLDAKKPQDMRTALDGVCITTMEVLSSEPCTIQGVVRDDLVLQHTVLSEKLLGLMGAKSEHLRHRFHAADFLSWLLKDSSNAFSRFRNDSALTTYVSRLIKDDELEVSWAGMRLLRNMSSYNKDFGMEFIEELQDISKRHDPQIAVYVCEIIASLAGHTHFDRHNSISRDFKQIYAGCIEVVLAILQKSLDSVEDQDLVLSKALVALRALHCPDLENLFHLLNYASGMKPVWNCLKKSLLSSIHELALDFIQILVDSKTCPVLFDGVSVKHLIHLLDSGGTVIDLKALKIFMFLQAAAPDSIFQYSEHEMADLLKKLHSILSYGSFEHQEVTITVLLGLLSEKGDYSRYSSKPYSIVEVLVTHLGCEKLQAQVLSALHLLLASGKDEHEVARTQALEAGIVTKLLQLLSNHLDGHHTPVLELLTALATTNGKQDLFQAGAAGLLVQCLGSMSHHEDLLTSCLTAIVKDDPLNLGVAIKSQLQKALCIILKKSMSWDIAYLLDSVLKSSEAIQDLQSCGQGVLRSLMNHARTTGKDLATLILSCVAQLVQNQVDTAFQFSEEDIAFFSSLLQLSDTDVKASVVRIIHSRLDAIMAQGEHLSQTVSYLCPPALDWDCHSELVQYILKILSCGVTQWPQSFPKSILGVPLLADHLWDMVDTKEEWNSQFNGRDVIRILRSIREFERNENIMDSSGQAVVFGLDQVTDVQNQDAGVSQESAPDNHVTPHNRSCEESLIKSLALKVQQLKHQLSAKEEALKTAQMEIETQAGDIEVMMECITQQHDRLETLSTAFEVLD